MLRWLFIAFLFVHGLVHLTVWVAHLPEAKDGKRPRYDPHRSWLFGTGTAARLVGGGLAIVACVLFVLGAVLLAAGAEAWRPVTAVASGVGLLVAVLFFNPWLLLDVAMNAALLYGLVVADWPSESFAGA